MKHRNVIIVKPNIATPVSISSIKNVITKQAILSAIIKQISPRIIAAIRFIQIPPMYYRME